MKKLFHTEEITYEIPFDFLLKEAEQGNEKAQYLLGQMYEKGTGIKPNYQKAVEWYTKAAEQGEIEAQFNLGI